jgi:hypothetical protein
VIIQLAEYMDAIWEIIIEGIVMALFTFPGAVIRWCLTGFRKRFTDVLFDDSGFNAAVGVLAVMGVVIFIVNL